MIVNAFFEFEFHKENSTTLYKDRTKRDGFLFRRKGIDFIAEKYNQRFTVIVEIGSFGLVLPGSKDPHYPYSIETQRRRKEEKERERERGGDIPRWTGEILESNYPTLPLNAAPSPRLYWILKRWHFGQKWPRRMRHETHRSKLFSTTAPNWSSLNYIWISIFIERKDHSFEFFCIIYSYFFLFLYTYDTVKRI